MTSLRVSLWIRLFLAASITGSQLMQSSTVFAELPEGAPPTRQAEAQAEGAPAAPTHRIKIETFSKQGTRSAGWLVLGTSLLLAGGLVIGGASSSRSCSMPLTLPSESSGGSGCQHYEREYHVESTYAIGALAVAGIGGTIGLVLISQDDEKRITISPYSPAAATTQQSGLVPSGLLLQGRF